MAEKSQKLSIGLVYDDTLDSSDGVAQYVKELGAWLSSRGHNVFYMCGETKATSWAGGKIYSLSKNLKVKFNGNEPSMSLFSKASDINKVLRQEKPDVIHVMMPYSPFMAQRVIKRAYKQSVVVSTFHIFPSGLVARAGTRLLGLFQHQSVKKINKYLAVSQAAQDFAKQTFKIETQVVPNMVDISKFLTSPQPKNSAKRIVFLGRLVERKGCRQLIEAFEIVHKDLPDVQLVIGGKGPEQAKLEALVNSLGLSDSVQFLGYVDEQVKPKLLNSADVACFPSLYGESFGIVLIEAMAAGSKVVLGGNNPGYSSVLDPQPKTLIDPTHQTEFANRLIELLSDNDLANTLHAWQEQYVKQFDTKVVASTIEKIYFDLIDKKQLNEA